MSDRKTPTRFARSILEAAPPKTPVSKKADMMIRGRHAAITNNFYNLRSYKEWAEKVRGTWK
jgi:hypothetical protein